MPDWDSCCDDFIEMKLNDIVGGQRNLSIFKCFIPTIQFIQRIHSPGSWKWGGKGFHNLVSIQRKDFLGLTLLSSFPPCSGFSESKLHPRVLFSLILQCEKFEGLRFIWLVTIKRVFFFNAGTFVHSYPIAKKSNVKECSSYHTIALISHASKVILKIL